MRSSSDLATTHVINPCKNDCHERAMLCHSTCEKYLTYRAELELIKDGISHQLADEKRKKEYAASAVRRMKYARR